MSLAAGIHGFLEPSKGHQEDVGSDACVPAHPDARMELDGGLGHPGVLHPSHWFELPENVFRQWKLC